MYFFPENSSPTSTTGRGTPRKPFLPTTYRSDPFLFTSRRKKYVFGIVNWPNKKRDEWVETSRVWGRSVWQSSYLYWITGQLLHTVNRVRLFPTPLRLLLYLPCNVKRTSFHPPTTHKVPESFINNRASDNLRRWRSPCSPLCPKMDLRYRPRDFGRV